METKLEEIKGIESYTVYNENKERIIEYKHHRELVDVLLARMNKILHRIADDIDPDGIMRMELNEYAEQSYYHKNTPSDVKKLTRRLND